MEILWEHPWLDWIGTFSRERSMTEKKISTQVTSILDSIIQKMMIFDLGRKNSVIKLKGTIVDDEGLMIQVAEVVLDYFCENPVIPAAHAHETLKNLLTLMKYMEKEVLPSLRVYQLFVDAMHNMVCSSTPEIRSLLKSIGLLDLRDDIVIQLLEGQNFSFEEQMQFVKRFSFGLVADQPKFRESNGLLFLLRILLLAGHDRSFQVFLSEIILNTFAPIDENKKMIIKIIDDPQVISRFFSLSFLDQDRGEEPTERASSLSLSSSNQSLDQVGKEATNSTTSLPNGISSSSPPPSPKTKHAVNIDMSPISLSKEGEAGSASKGERGSIEGFFNWFYSNDPDCVLKRSALEQRIEKLVLPLTTLNMRSQEKLMTRRNKKLKTFRDKQLRTAGALNKSLTESKTKSSQKLAKYAASHQQQQDALRVARHERAKTGEEIWKKILASWQEKYGITA